MDRLPFATSYASCRADFRRTASATGATSSAHPLSVLGPGEVDLTIDVAALGSRAPRRALVVLAGVHGVEGFACSPIMCDALARWGGVELPDDVGVLLVHAVNPWGMAWLRRQNESNVDLNRNWGVTSETVGDDNPGYAELHADLCPDGTSPPSPDSFLRPMQAIVDERGEEWVRAAISDGQSTHPDGLYFTGHRTAESTGIVADIASDHLADAECVVVVDLHTGYGAYGDLSLLVRHEPDSPGDEWSRSAFPGADIVNTVKPGAAPRRGQIAGGLADVVPGAEFHAVTAEFGTRSEVTMILAERSEHWVHRHGDRTDPEHARIVDHHLRCSTPADTAWQHASVEQGRAVLDLALAAAQA